MSRFDEQFKVVTDRAGFIAALDQSGGSTPKALAQYGIGEDAWADADEMFDRVHEMRTRIIKSPAFTSERILGAILFENTVDRRIDDRPTAEYLWEVKRIVPFLKVDSGLADERGGVQVMKPIPELGRLLDKANANGMFGTKMRSVIKQASPDGVARVVEQQFEIGGRIIDTGLVPIIEPEVDIHCPDKAEAESLLLSAIVEQLDGLADDRTVMLKLTLPEQDDLYRPCIEHPRVARVVALSGGYSREEANARLARNHGMTASFSRALAEGLTAQQSDAEFDAMLDASIRSIYESSTS